MAADDEPPLVFVYGTLRSGFSNAGRDVLTRHGDFRATGTVVGTLYDLGSFPAMVEAEQPDDRVVGEVYELARNPETALERLDRYEGARGPSPLPYERRSVEAELPQETKTVWTYVWTGDVEGSERIESGDYATWLET